MLVSSLRVVGWWKSNPRPRLQSEADYRRSSLLPQILVRRRNSAADRAPMPLLAEFRSDLRGDPAFCAERLVPVCRERWKAWWRLT